MSNRVNEDSAPPQTYENCLHYLDVVTLWFGQSGGYLSSRGASQLVGTTEQSAYLRERFLLLDPDDPSNGGLIESGAAIVIRDYPTNRHLDIGNSGQLVHFQRQNYEEARRWTITDASELAFPDGCVHFNDQDAAFIRLRNQETRLFLQPVGNGSANALQADNFPTSRRPQTQTTSG